MARPVTVTFTVADSRGREVEITADVTPGYAGQSYGPPERCSPPEAGDVEVVKAEAIDFGADVAEVLRDYDRLAAAAEVEAENVLADQAAVAADYRRDSWRDGRIQ